MSTLLDQSPVRRESGRASYLPPRERMEMERLKHSDAWHAATEQLAAQRLAQQAANAADAQMRHADEVRIKDQRIADLKEQRDRIDKIKEADEQLKQRIAESLIVKREADAAVANAKLAEANFKLEQQKAAALEHASLIDNLSSLAERTGGKFTPTDVIQTLNLTPIAANHPDSSKAVAFAMKVAQANAKSGTPDPYRHSQQLYRQINTHLARGREIDSQIRAVQNATNPPHWATSTGIQADSKGVERFGFTDKKLQDSPQVTPAEKQQFIQYQSALAERTAINQKIPQLQEQMDSLMSGEQPDTTATDTTARQPATDAPAQPAAPDTTAAPASASTAPAIDTAQPEHQQAYDWMNANPDHPLAPAMRKLYGFQ